MYIRPSPENIYTRDAEVTSSERQYILLSRPQAWKKHLISANVSDDDLNTTADLTLTTIRYSEDDIDRSLQGLSIDHLGALAVSVERLGLVRYNTDSSPFAHHPVTNA